MKKLLFFGVIAVLLSSCMSTNRGFQSSPVLARNVELDPIKADIKVDETKKLKGESTTAYFLFFKVSGDDQFADGVNYSTDVSESFNPFKLLQKGRLQKVRGAAAYKALSSGDYDVLVHPTYVTTVKNYLIYKEYVVTVEGYGAKYSNFRTEKQKVVITGNAKEYVFPEK
jgi:hypothetical protein